MTLTIRQIHNQILLIAKRKRIQGTGYPLPTLTLTLTVKEVSLETVLSSLRIVYQTR